MYKKHLESFVKKKGMTIKTKFGILIPVTIVMGIGFFLMMRGGILVPSVILAIVWVWPYHLFWIWGQDAIYCRRREVYEAC